MNILYREINYYQVQILIMLNLIIIPLKKKTIKFYT